MKIVWAITFFPFLVGAASTTVAGDAPPNVLLILADDLGYSDLGCYGSEIETPNLDRLAANGLRFTQFYNTARCWPTRAALLTGYYPQQVRRDTLPEIRSGGGGVRPEWARLLPEMLARAGYRSYHSGKWHIDGSPLENGFSRSYLLQDQGRFFSPQTHSEDDQPLPAVSRDEGYYATTAIADHAIRCLSEHAEQYANQPFFHYLAFTAPHFPLHARPEDIAKYRERYGAGWDAIRADRWERMRSMGLVVGERSPVEYDVGPPYDFPDDIAALGPGEVNRPVPWVELMPEQQEFQATKMAIHAAMIDRMDQEIGRVLDQIESMGELEDTLILFLSDNGASAEIMIRDDGHDPAADPGSAASHLCLGPGWSTVCNTPFRRHKTWVHEGGIATPLIVSWPNGIAARNELRHTAGHVIDIVPTLSEVTGCERFRLWEDVPTPLPPGLSLVPAFESDGQVAHSDLWWWHEGNRAFRRGDWKIVAAGVDAPWELYNLAADRAETNNLAAEHPDLVQALDQAWNDHVRKFQRLASADLEDPPVATEPIKDLILSGEAVLIAGRPAFVFMPPEELRQTPQPWVMYGPTLPGYPDTHEQWMHEQFLAAGIAVAGIDVGEAYGSPWGNEGLDALYHTMVKRGYSERPVLLGRSRGGLWVSSWAAENLDKVAGIAGIYPVFDLTTYPRIENAAPSYGLTTEALMLRLAEFNPIARVHRLAEAGIPACFIHGDIDEVVPLEANSAAFVGVYEAAGKRELVNLIVAEGQGHNYWEGFFRCQELVDFVIERAKGPRE
jgi:arylsulfatase